MKNKIMVFKLMAIFTLISLLSPYSLGQSNTLTFKVICLKESRWLCLKKKNYIVITSNDIQCISKTLSHDSSALNVSIKLSAAAGKRLQNLTVANVGKPMEILLDHRVIREAVLRSPIGSIIVLPQVSNYLYNEIQAKMHLRVCQ